MSSTGEIQLSDLYGEICNGMTTMNELFEKGTIINFQDTPNVGVRELSSYQEALDSNDSELIDRAQRVQGAFGASAGKHWQYLQLLDNPEFSDVVFLVGDADELRYIYAHRGILCAASTYFEAMFDHDLLEAHSREVRVPGVRPDVLMLLLEYLYAGNELLARPFYYTDKAREPPVEHWIELRNLAQMYLLEPLAQLARQRVVAAIRPDNFVGLWMLAKTRRKAYGWIREHLLATLRGDRLLFQKVFETGIMEELSKEEILEFTSLMLREK